MVIQDDWQEPAVTVAALRGSQLVAAEGQFRQAGAASMEGQPVLSVRMGRSLVPVAIVGFHLASE